MKKRVILTGKAANIIIYTYEGNRAYVRKIINAKQEPSKRYK